MGEFFEFSNSRVFSLAHRVASSQIWPLPILAGVYFAPESPWYLVRAGRLEEAKRSLIELGSERPGAIPADERIKQIQHTNEMEKLMSSGTSYLDCFRGTNLRRTEIAAVAWMIQSESSLSSVTHIRLC